MNVTDEVPCGDNEWESLQAQNAQLRTTISQLATEIERLKEFEWMYKELCK